MLRALCITREQGSKAELLRTLTEGDIVCSFAAYGDGLEEAIAEGRPAVYLLEIDGLLSPGETAGLLRRLKKDGDRPVIALVPRDRLAGLDPALDIDDFILGPYDGPELITRIRRRIAAAGGGEENGDEVIRREGIIINLTTCEVRVDGAMMELTFKEYELLKLLAANPGRVYTREALLDKIWGYDYIGGDRTVDVHIRRLRSKIESTGRNYIETVRNIGYRFTQSA